MVRREEEALRVVRRGHHAASLDTASPASEARLHFLPTLSTHVADTAMLTPLVRNGVLGMLRRWLQTAADESLTIDGDRFIIQSAVVAICHALARAVSPVHLQQSRGLGKLLMIVSATASDKTLRQRAAEALRAMLDTRETVRCESEARPESSRDGASGAHTSFPWQAAADALSMSSCAGSARVSRPPVGRADPPACRPTSSFPPEATSLLPRRHSPPAAAQERRLSQLSLPPGQAERPWLCSQGHRVPKATPERLASDGAHPFKRKHHYHGASSRHKPPHGMRAACEAAALSDFKMQVIKLVKVELHGKGPLEREVFKAAARAATEALCAAPREGQAGAIRGGRLPTKRETQEAVAFALRLGSTH